MNDDVLDDGQGQAEVKHNPCIPATGETRVEPLNENVVIELIEKEQNDIGIIIPDSVDKEAPQRGRVVAYNPSEQNRGVHPLLEEGSVVLYSKYAGQRVEVEGAKLIIVPRDSILAIIKKY